MMRPRPLSVDVRARARPLLIRAGIRPEGAAAAGGAHGNGVLISRLPTTRRVFRMRVSLGGPLARVSDIFRLRFHRAQSKARLMNGRVSSPGMNRAR